MRLRLVLLFCLAMLTGCMPTLTCPPVNVMSFSEFLKLPRQWEAPTLYVRLPANVKYGDPSIEYATALCKEFAIRLYDATDGQVHISRFVIVNPSVMDERDEGMCNLFDKSSIIYKNEAYVSKDTILHPGRFYCQMPNGPGEINESAGIMLHEWFHTFIGLGDEYKRAGDIGNTVRTGCPLKGRPEFCVMTESRVRRELCRPENHNADTDQGKESCYAKLARLLLDNNLAYITIPKETILGPYNPPTPKINIVLK